MKYDYINLIDKANYLIRFKDNDLRGLVNVESRREAKKYASSFPHIKKAITKLN